MTCHWDLTDGQPELAFAAGMSTALWTLHESGPAPFDWVVAASVGGPERQLERLAHASDGTGKWLGGVAGAGRALGYSWDEVEYVDKVACCPGPSLRSSSPHRPGASPTSRPRGSWPTIPGRARTTSSTSWTVTTAPRWDVHPCAGSPPRSRCPPTSSPC